ncbi:MAG: right-handed parallel beta-helix repeat-containing protein [Saprospiraceae bacterium]|nr:right-handed parallel beta-helix repeat-containing protein [Saprospiraceae bacterium]
MKQLIYLCLLALIAITIFSNCEQDEFDFTTDSNAKLEFSLDTLRFDTVFTELGSATRSFKIYNRNDKAIRISDIFLESGNNLRWQMNVDGIPGNAQQDVEVLAKDSIYVFVEVTIDPDQPLSASPFVIEDRVVFETNGNTQYVNLEAWGQNANYFPSRFNKGVAVRLTCNNGPLVWDDPKPYVIYGAVFVDSCELVIPAGARIYVHGGVAQNDLFGGIYNDGILYIQAAGKLTIQGTKEKPVIIQGDRLEESFLDDAGQWNGIVLSRGSKGNTIDYATIRNSRFGILVDSTADLTVRNSQFYNTVSSGIIGYRSRITAENCLIYNNGATSVLFLQGGDYNFTYCTIASYGVNASALGMSNFFCHNEDCSSNTVYRLVARFKNSIIYGSQNDEIELSDAREGKEPLLFDIRFEDCIVKVEELLRVLNGRYANFFDEQCDPCLNPQRSDKLFVKPDENDYHLDSLSVAQGLAKPIISPKIIDIDLEGKPRDATKPDIGCYEREN